jgi:signal transduction histidine kinase
MSDRAARGIAAGLVALVFVLEVAAVCLTVGEAGLTEAVLYLVYAVTQAGAGALIIHRFPRHTIGWLLLAYALLNAVCADFALAYGARAAGRSWPGGEVAELLGMTSWIFAASGLILLFLLFPDGRLPGRRWRAVPYVWAAGALLTLPGWALNPRLDGEFAAGENPFAVAGFPAEPVFAVGALLICSALVSSLVAIVNRLRRAEGVERDQLKWVVLAAGIICVVLPTSAALWTVWEPIQVLSALALVLLPVSACVAVLRHRLYDVDVVIARTVAYVVCAGLLVAVYAAVVAVAASYLSSPLAAAAAALVVAVTFRPVHERVQSVADRWLRPARHRARASITAFVDAVRRGEAQAADLEAAFQRALDDESLSLTLELPDGEVVDADGQPVGAVVPGDGARPVRRVPAGAGATALLRHRAEDERLVTAVAEAGGFAIEIAALQVQLRSQVREVEASRVRIQSVADEERRRIARDLHDGAQQRLVAIGLALRHAQLSTTDSSMGAAVDDAVSQLTASIHELRELAGGLRPSSLDDGLDAALRELATRTPVRLDVVALPERFPQHVETAAYFVACEAVTNAVKHADASRISVTLAHERDSLVVTVVDDGRGGAEPSRGTGLVGMADRIRAHHGQLSVDSPAGGGTRLEVRLPCA